MDFEALDFLTGTVTTFLAGMLVVLAQCRRNLRNLLRKRVDKGPLSQALKMEALSVPVDWIKQGSPAFLHCLYAESPDRRTASGLWSCEGNSTFEWRFDSDETVYVLEGRVEIDYLGKHFVLQPGDSAFFYTGTRALWHVPQYVRKTYMVHSPNILVRAARMLLRTGV